MPPPGFTSFGRKMNGMLTILSVLALVLLPTIGWGASSDANIADLQKRIATLEDQRDLLKKDFENKKNELANAITAQKNQLDKDANQLRENIKKKYYLLGLGAIIFGSVALISIITTFLRLRSFIEKSMRKVIGKVLNDRKDLILKLVAEQDTELKLREQKRVLVLTPAGSDDIFFRNFLTGTGFSNADFQTSKGDYSDSEADIVILNDKDNLFDKGRIQALLRELPRRTIRFYFGHSQIDVPEPYKDITAFATAPTQLYGNLMNALRYQSVL